MSIEPICAICGAPYGLHRYKAHHCPKKGLLETDPNHTEFADTIFTPIIAKKILPPDIQNIIEEEAESTAKSGTPFSERHNMKKYMFKEGINFILNNPQLMKQPFENFENWLQYNDWTFDGDFWYDKDQNHHNFNSVFLLYIESAKR